MTDMLRIAEEAAEQAKFSLVSIDLNTIVFTLINTLIIVLLYFFFLHKPVCKILDERAKTVNKDMDDAQKAKEEAFSRAGISKPNVPVLSLAISSAVKQYSGDISTFARLISSYGSFITLSSESINLISEHSASFSF